MDEAMRTMTNILDNVVPILQIISSVMLCLFMYFSAKNRNKNLGIGWYIAGLFFPLITIIVFLYKSKKFPGADMKVCPICGDKYPMVYEVCGRCLVELPKNTEEEKKKQGRIARICGVCFAVTFLVSTILTTISIAGILKGFVEEGKKFFDNLESYEYSSRIAITDETGTPVYYDKKGNAYSAWEDVLLYDAEGATYTYSFDEETYDSFFIKDNGKKYRSYDCYVDENGLFIYDENFEITYFDTELYEGESDYEYEDEIPDSYEAIVDEFYADLEDIDDSGEYKYYENYYTDSDGNIYFGAEEASWNEEGELITAKNDPTVSE